MRNSYDAINRADLQAALAYAEALVKLVDRLNDRASYRLGAILDDLNSRLADVPADLRACIAEHDEPTWTEFDLERDRLGDEADSRRDMAEAG